MTPEPIGTPSSSPAGAPCFVVGQDCDGHWLAVETHGLGGGIFVSRDAAWHYAWSLAGRRREAVSVAAEPIVLACDERSTGALKRD